MSIGSVYVTVRGQEIEVCEILISPEDRSVGIMGPYPDGYLLKLDGKVVEWELTDDEYEMIDKAIMKVYETYNDIG